MVPASRVKAWAIARSIYRTAYLLGIEEKKIPLKPMILNQKTISFGSDLSIIFTDQELIKLYRKKIAIPKLVPVFQKPRKSLLKLLKLRKVGQFFKSKSLEPNDLGLLFAVGIETTAVYMNFHPKCSSVIGGGCGVIEFFLSDDKHPMAVLQKSDNRGWQFKTKRTMNPSVKVIFKDIEVVKLLCMGNLDHNEGLALGELVISGNIPIMDKVSYCSKIALSELPLFTS